jgi:hypothetical protein
MKATKLLLAATIGIISQSSIAQPADVMEHCRKNGGIDGVVVSVDSATPEQEACAGSYAMKMPAWSVANTCDTEKVPAGERVPATRVGVSANNKTVYLIVPKLFNPGYAAQDQVCIAVSPTGTFLAKK